MQNGGNVDCQVTNRSSLEVNPIFQVVFAPLIPDGPSTPER